MGRMLRSGHAASSIALALLGAGAIAAIFLAAAHDRDDPAGEPLDWSAPYRWVHFDNLDPAKAAAFEDARNRWLRVLGKNDRWLDDGRALFWHARAGAVQAFFTFYPFRRFADLDVRRETVARTNEIVGRAATDAYAAGDVALVAPHHSEIWSRDPDQDVAAPAVVDLTELTAAVGRLEFQEPDVQKESRLGALWKTVRETLEARSYPLACRTFRSAFGTGEIVRLWLARDSAAMASAPSISSVLEKGMGEAAAKALLAELDVIVKVRRTVSVERRADLSNLPR
jgi:hypothetical protein